MDVERKRKREEARSLRVQGRTYSAIARRLQVPQPTIAFWCKGLTSKGEQPARDKRKKELLPTIRALYSEGVPGTQIAKDIGIGVTTLYDWLNAEGWQKKKRSAYVTDELRERISKKLTVDPDGVMRKEAIEMYVEQEIATTEIAEKLGVTSVTVAQWLEQEGIARRQSPTLRTREKLREANLGEKRYNWKGGISTENRRHRLSMYMRDARKACFERDDYTCRSCGQRGGTLNAHHVWPFQRWQEWKYEVWNLVTLCKLCHDNWHKAAGGHVKIAIGPFFAGRIA